MESRVHELEKQRLECDAARLDAVEKAEDRVKKAVEQKDVAERESLVVRYDSVSPVIHSFIHSFLSCTTMRGHT